MPFPRLAFHHLLAGALLIGCGAVPALAHPHVWVDTLVTPIITDGKITALREEWSFDEDFTATVLGDVRKIKGMAAAAQPKDFTAGEVAKLKQDAFSNLRNYDYFTHLWEKGKVVGVAKEVGDFSARLQGEKLFYSFVLPLTAPITLAGTDLHIGIWDDTYYVDVGPTKEQSGAKLEGKDAAACHTAVAEDKDHPIYNGSIFPKTVRITC